MLTMEDEAECQLKKKGKRILRRNWRRKRNINNEMKSKNEEQNGEMGSRTIHQKEEPYKNER